MFKLALLLHIAGALIWFGGLSLSVMAGILARQAKTTGQLRDLAILWRWLPAMFGPSSVILVITGLYMAWQRSENHESIGWIIVALIMFGLLSAAGSAYGQKMATALRGQLAHGPEGNLPADLVNLLHHPAVRAQSYYSIAGGLGILVLMVYQPSVMAAIAVLVVSLAVGMLVGGALLRPARD